MSACTLCHLEADPRDLDRVSGVDLCARCRTDDPADALKDRGIEAEFNAALGWFRAGVGLPGQQAGFHLRCGPEMLHHKLVKLFAHEVQVGDPTFDGAVYVRSSDPERAAALLASEGVQSALLGLLSGLRINDLLPNHVTLDGPTLTVAVRPLGGLPEARIHELKLEVAALVLQWADPG